MFPNSLPHFICHFSFVSDCCRIREKYVFVTSGDDDFRKSLLNNQNYFGDLLLFECYVHVYKFTRTYHKIRNVKAFCSVLNQHFQSRENRFLQLSHFTSVHFCWFQHSDGGAWKSLKGINVEDDGRNFIRFHCYRHTVHDSRGCRSLHWLKGNFTHFLSALLGVHPWVRGNEAEFFIIFGLWKPHD